MKLGHQDIQDALQRYADLRDESIEQAVSKTKFPKNVILFIGDGMSIATVTGARIHKGQKMFKHSGEEQFLSWERFPASALMKVNIWGWPWGMKLNKQSVLEHDFIVYGA